MKRTILPLLMLASATSVLACSDKTEVTTNSDQRAPMPSLPTMAVRAMRTAASSPFPSPVPMMEDVMVPSVSTLTPSPRVETA